MKINIEREKKEKKIYFNDLLPGDIFYFTSDENIFYIKTDEQGCYVELEEGYFYRISKNGLTEECKKLKAELFLREEN